MKKDEHSIALKSLLYLSVIITLFCFGSCSTPISPGELVEAHQELEGSGNCKECHALGNRVSEKKCLACHTEIADRINKEEGYHASEEVSGKKCFDCHSDHHGKDFEIIHFSERKFDHALTGYDLNGSHRKVDCRNCHHEKHIEKREIKKRENTFLGLQKDCIICHDDYHQNTLDTDCGSCHDFNSFRPAPYFEHDKTNFSLLGKHENTDCISCHEIGEKNGKEFQHFSKLEHESCVSCHEDVHDDKFGQNCQKCHSEESFHKIRGVRDFDHSKTGYMLTGMHLYVACKMCHKNGITTALKHDECKDCHSDYHENEFAQNGVSPDCRKCHTVESFRLTTYTVDMHNNSVFPLKGAHAAIACTECHLDQDKWHFRERGKDCVDCHTDIHEKHISSQYYPDNDCRNCHSEEGWHQIAAFDHSKTGFALSGAHERVSCRQCHFLDNENKKSEQKFKSLGNNCLNCHQDIHYDQFSENGNTDCNRCHGFNDWSPVYFDHDNTEFKLDGRHENVACNQCHFEITKNDITYINFKIKDFRCEACH